MATTPPRPPAIGRPAHDEWGVYDPDQAGLAALFARLDLKAAKAKAESKPEPVAATETPRITGPLSMSRFRRFEKSGWRLHRAEVSRLDVSCLP